MSKGLPDPTLSFCEVLARRARDEPERIGLSSVTFSKLDLATTTYSCAALMAGARDAAAVLSGSGAQAGDRVVLSLASAPDFSAFWVGARCLGLVPIPAPFFASMPALAYSSRIGSIVRDAEPVAVIVDDRRASDALESRTIELVHGAGVAGGAARGPASNVPPGFNPARSLDETAFLQYTSGSTGSPKGVAVLEYNLIANLRAISEAGGMGAGDIIYSWLPLFHDMGFVGALLLGQYLGIPTFVALPKTFATRPETWLAAISRLRATISMGPNFAFSALARRPEGAVEGLDLSSWRLAVDGAEIVDPTTAHDFTARYARHGFAASSLRPSYGLAEATLAVAFPRPGTSTNFDTIDRLTLGETGAAIAVRRDAPGAVTYTSVGTAIPAHRVRILDPSSAQELGERQLGEVAVSGPSVTPGYFRDLRAGAPRCTELRTGDLGYLADGELYIVGRLKDVLVIAGRKYLPPDVERVIGAVNGLRSGSIVAFSARGQAGTEELFVVAALSPEASHRKDAIHREIQRTLHDFLGLTARGICFTKPGLIPKTTSGKLRRAECRKMMDDGRLAPWAHRAG